MLKTLKVIAVNKPKGTITVMWNNDPKLEWNYFIPMDENNVPLTGDAMLRSLIAASYEAIVYIETQRTQDEVRATTDFSQYNSLKRKKFNIEGMVKEYESATEKD